MPLGGGEGSIIHYCFQIGQCLIKLAESRAIKFSPVQRSWVSELQFLDEFKNFEELKEILNECDDERLHKYIRDEITDLERG